MRTMYMLPSEPFLDPSYTRHRLCQLSKDSDQDFEIAAKYTILTITVTVTRIPFCPSISRSVVNSLLLIQSTPRVLYFPTPLVPVDT